MCLLRWQRGSGGGIAVRKQDVKGTSDADDPSPKSAALPPSPFTPTQRHLATINTDATSHPCRFSSRERHQGAAQRRPSSPHISCFWIRVGWVLPARTNTHIHNIIGTETRKSAKSKQLSTNIATSDNVASATRQHHEFLLMAAYY